MQVLGITLGGKFLVGDSGENAILECGLFQAFTAAPVIFPETGDSALVRVLDAQARRGLILGKEIDCNTDTLPEEIVISAKQKVSVICGKSINIWHANGNVFTKGKNLLSKARQTNKIKGNSVGIN
jgi:hypothetical protein